MESTGTGRSRNGSTVDNRSDPGNHRAFGVHPGSWPSLVRKDLAGYQLRRRKNAQAGLGVTTSLIGLGALAARGGAAGAKHWIVPAEKAAQVEQKLKNTSTGALTVGAGIGGIAGLNSASVAHEEAKKLPTKKQHISSQKSAFGVKS